MVDKELLEAIGQMMEAQEKRLSDMMDTKLAQQRKEIMQDVKALLDTDVQTRFNLLAEDPRHFEGEITGGRRSGCNARTA